ncbi:hypothetical protein EDD21DRAFT_370034 [Dissophora ornata]|nr:hypothetical protein EDD21DRAFT_370034 [Dissophora ornata]
MKFSYSILLISVAIAAIASAAPMPAHESANTITEISSISKRCAECTPKDGAALDLVANDSAKHYAKIFQVRLDGLMRKMEATQVTSGAVALPNAKAALTISVKSKIEKAKKDCTSEALAPAIKAAMTSDMNMDIPWSNKEEVGKKMVDLNALITAIILERIRANVNAETLSKDCAERMTNTQIAPAPAEMLAPEALASEALAPAPETLAPAPEAPVEDKGGLRVGIDFASNVDLKYVCKSGCQDSQVAYTVLNLRRDLERKFASPLEYFYNEEVPTDCTEKSGELFGSVSISLERLNAVGGTGIVAGVMANIN